MDIKDVVKVIATAEELPAPQYLYAGKTGQIINIEQLDGRPLYRVQFSMEESMSGADHTYGVGFWAQELAIQSHLVDADPLRGER